MTRHRVIDAAIQVFGMEGFERTSTRAVVERAGTNLVAIHYYFGGKEGLYTAAAAHIAATIRERTAAVIERAGAVASDPTASRRDLIEQVCAIYDEFTDPALAGGIPEGWRMFMLREQTAPTGTGALELLLGAMQPFFEAVFTLVARLLDKPAGHPEVRLLSTMIFGQVSVFRTSQAVALRLLGWKRFGPEELRTIRATARKHIFTLLSAADGAEQGG